jgi:MoaA/NifB/PqqE/SkfB family radical SAM enzyme
MPLRAKLRPLLAPTLKRYAPLWGAVKDIDLALERSRHSAARVLPVLVRPEPRRLQIAITAHCNLACVGCRYGRDFMRGAQLEWSIVEPLLDDARAAGMWDVRFYGGEPLLHPDLPRMIAYALELGLQPFVTTNGMLLARKLDALHGAGLRHLTIGYYGTGAAYDAYVQRSDRFRRLERNVAAMRERYGSEISLQINWLLMRPSCNVEALDAACDFALRHGATIQVDLVHYSLPYFSTGPDGILQFQDGDRPAIEAIAREIEARARLHPGLFHQSPAGLRSIPDWLMLRETMRVPCDSHQMIWVGADGSVQQCYVTFELGNLHRNRLSEILFTAAHRQAARDSFELNCPNCHCNYDKRIDKDAASMRRYGRR